MSAVVTSPERRLSASDRARDHDDPIEPRACRRARWLWLVLLLIVTCAALAHLASIRPGWDSHAERAIVERTARLGGTYYTTGADQKGPLWLGSYSLILHLTSPRTFWAGLALAIVLIGGLTALAVRVILRQLGLAIWVADAAATATYIYLIAGPEEYSRVLYSRNIVGLLVAWSFALVLRATAHDGRTRLVECAAAGVLAGFAANTMPSSGLDAVVLLLLVARLAFDAREAWRVAVVFAGSAAVAFLAFPLWYLARGVFHDYWLGWWTYNQIYSRSTGRGLVAQFVHGAGVFVDYYREHVVFAMAVAGFGIWLARRQADRRRRWIGLAIVAWWLSELLSVTLAQRFFPHYFALPFFPVAVMAGVVLQGVVNAFRLSTRYIGPIVVAVLVFFAAPAALSDGLRRAKEFRGPSTLEKWELRTLTPEQAELRKVVATYSRPGEYAYVWSHFPWLYSAIQRLSASRYIENRWLTGETYGGSYSPDNILPGTWDRWRDDMRRTPPVVVVVPADEPVPPGSPLAALLTERFVKAQSIPSFGVYVTAERMATGPKA